MTPNPIPKLPVWKTIVEVFAVTARHTGDLLRFAWPWLIVLIAVSLALYSAYFETERAQLAAGGSGSSSLWVLTLMVSTLIGALIAVPWHRRILLGEHQTLSKGLALDSRKLAYAVKTVAIIATLALPLVPLVWTGSAEPASDVETQTATELFLAIFLPVLAFVAFFAWVFVLNRVSLILPATAVGNGSVTLGSAWSATKGNTLRLALVSTIATFLPLMLPLGLAYWLAPATAAALDASTAPNAIAFAVTNTINELLTIVFGMLFVTFLSLSYRHFFGNPLIDRSGTLQPN